VIHFFAIKIKLVGAVAHPVIEVAADPEPVTIGEVQTQAHLEGLVVGERLLVLVEHLPGSFAKSFHEDFGVPREYSIGHEHELQPGLFWTTRSLDGRRRSLTAVPERVGRLRRLVASVPLGHGLAPVRHDVAGAPVSTPVHYFELETDRGVHAYAVFHALVPMINVVVVEVVPEHEGLLGRNVPELPGHLLGPGVVEDGNFHRGAGRRFGRWTHGRLTAGPKGR